MRAAPCAAGWQRLSVQRPGLGSPPMPDAPIRILLVEDEVLNRALVRATLTRADDARLREADLVEAPTIADARQALNGGRFRSECGRRPAQLAASGYPSSAQGWVRRRCLTRRSASSSSRTRC